MKYGWKTEWLKLAAPSWTEHCSFIYEVIVFVWKARPSTCACYVVLTEPKVRLSASKALIREQTGTKLCVLQILPNARHIKTHKLQQHTYTFIHEVQNKWGTTKTNRYWLRKNGKLKPIFQNSALSYFIPYVTGLS